MHLVDRMAADLNIDVDFIMGISHNSSKYYSRYNIKKKSGGVRRIFHPSPILKTFQYWLSQNIFRSFPASSYATAYGTGCSIKKNAEQHQHATNILHMDIENFFESIKSEHIQKLFLENPKLIEDLSLDSEDIDLICKICLYKDHLTIGSVTSPIISNCIMYSFDVDLAKLLPTNIVYTRYADDMVFSSRMYIDSYLQEIVTQCLIKHGFRKNSEKTRFMSKAGRRTITGLTLDRGKVSIGYERKQEIKRLLYNKLRHNLGDGQKILGLLFFLKDIEPNYFNKLIVKYSGFGNVLGVLRSDGAPNHVETTKLLVAVTVEDD